MTATLDRNGVAAFASMLLAWRSGVHATGHAQGAADAAYGRIYSHGRTTSADKSDYDLGWRVGRFVLFAKVPAWRAGMLTHVDAVIWWQRFKVSRDTRPCDPE